MGPSHFWYHWKILDKVVAHLLLQNVQINEAKVIEFKMIFVFENQLFFLNHNF